MRKWGPGRILDHEGRALMNGIHALKKMHTKLPCPFYHVGTLGKDAICEPGCSPQETPNLPVL